MANKQVVLITGATSGIGLLIANKLHNSGFKVFGTGRYPEKHQDKVSFELLPLDVNSDESIAKCIETLLKKTRVLDVLINNAGYALGGVVEDTSIEQAQKLFDTNFWGAVKMTKAILPLMREQRSGQIITTGSLSGLIGLPAMGYYSASKHALEGFFKSLRFEVMSFNIKVSVIEPAFYKTNIDSAAELAPESIKDYDKIRKQVKDFVANTLANASTSEPVAELVLKIIKSKEPKFSYPIGKNSRLLPALQFLMPAVYERGFLKKLKL